MNQNMRGFLLATQEIVGAVARDDFAAAEVAAKKLGYTEEREKMARKTAGSQTAFAGLAIGFFRGGDTIVEAARRKDAKATLTALETTITSCNACHSAYRQTIVETKP